MEEKLNETINEEVSESLQNEEIGEEKVEEVINAESTVTETPKEEKKGIFKKKEDAEKKRLLLENEQLKDKYLRVNAEMQNMRRRMEEEKANLIKYEGEDVFKKLLPVIDNFERALNMNSQNMTPEVEKFLNGFNMINGNIKAIFESFDVKEMDVINKPFDPNTMEAVLAEEVDGVEANIVVDVLQKGYTYKGKVIRHAMVKVSK